MFARNNIRPTRNGGVSSEPSKQAWGKTHKRSDTYYFGKWSFHIPLLFLVVFGVLPFVLVCAQSFSELNDNGTFSKAWSLVGYKDIFQPYRLAILFRIVRRALFIASIDTILAIPISYAMVRIVSYRIRVLCLLCFTIPFLASDLTRAFSWEIVLGQGGIVNSGLTLCHVIKEPIQWLLFSEFAVVVALISATLPLSIFPPVLQLSSVPQNVWLASEDLGITRGVELRKIALPLSRTALAFGWAAAFVVSIGSAAESEMLGGVRRTDLVRVISDLEAARNLPAVFALSSVMAGMLLVGAIILGRRLLAYDILGVRGTSAGGSDA